MTTDLPHEIPNYIESGEVLSWIRKVSGADVVFPGHPVVIACAIMALYRDVGQVTAKTKHCSRQAMADMRVPGAGDCVRAAVHALTCGSSVGEMLDYMRQYWSRSQAGGHKGNVDPGIAQALKLEPYFRENVETWLGLTAMPQNPAVQEGRVRKHADPLTDELEALVNEVDAAVRSARFLHADMAISEVRELCYLINLEDKSDKPRSLQTPATILYGLLKGFGICGLVTNRQIVDFANLIFLPNRPAEKTPVNAHKPGRKTAEHPRVQTDC